MPYNGAGTFTIGTTGNPVVYDTIIDETHFNGTMTEIATGLSTALCKDGQSLPTQNIPFNAKRITNLATASAMKDAMNGLSVAQNTLTYAASHGGTADAITISTLIPTDMVLVAGLQIWFTGQNANTGAVTVNVNSLGVKDQTRIGAVALTAGDIQPNALYCMVYDGTRFQLINHIPAQGTWTPSVGGTATYSNQIGRYTKVGRTCHITGDMTITTIGSGSTTTISGLPFASANVMDVPITVGTFASLTSSVVWIGGIVVINTSTIALRHLTAAAANPLTSGILGNSSRVCFSASYQMAV